MTIFFEKTNYLDALKQNEHLFSSDSIVKSTENVHFKHGTLSYEGFSKCYSNEGWVYRKIIALPAAAWTASVQLIYHLTKAIFIGIPKARSDGGLYLKVQIFHIPRDVQESWGRLSSLFQDKYGSFHIQESQYQKTYYESFLAKSAHEPNGQIPKHSPVKQEKEDRREPPFSPGEKPHEEEGNSKPSLAVTKDDKIETSPPEKFPDLDKSQQDELKMTVQELPKSTPKIKPLDPNSFPASYYYDREKGCYFSFAVEPEKIEAALSENRLEDAKNDIYHFYGTHSLETAKGLYSIIEKLVCLNKGKLSDEYKQLNYTLDAAHSLGCSIYTITHNINPSRQTRYFVIPRHENLRCEIMKIAIQALNMVATAHAEKSEYSKAYDALRRLDPDIVYSLSCSIFEEWTSYIKTKCPPNEQHAQKSLLNDRWESLGRSHQSSKRRF